MERNFKPEDGMAIITQMIAETRENVSDGSKYYLIWGWATFIAAATHYLLIVNDSPLHYLPWPILMPIAGIASGILSYRDKNKTTVKTHLDTAMSYLWIGFAAVLFISLGVSFKLGWTVTYPIIMWLYGLGTFVSGGILKFRPLIVGGIGAWVLGTVAVFAPFDQQLLLLAAAIMVSYIIPGHLLTRAK